MSDFSHLKNKLLAEQVEDQIYHYILDTPIEPGAKLPNEFALGEKFRVGRSTIREAIKLLSSKGIVEVRQGSGTYVVTTVKGLSDPLNLRSVQDKNALAFDLVNLRLLLEPGIAEIAAQNATPEDIERLQRLCERVEAKIRDGDRYIPRRVLHASVMKQFVIATLEGVEGEDAANRLRGVTVYAAREDLPLAEGAFFIADLIGTPVRHADTGEALGILSDVTPGATADLYTVTLNSGKDVLIPAVPAFVVKTDPEDAVLIRPIPGLLGEEDTDR